MKLTEVKWMGPNYPMVKLLRNDTRICLTKRELKDLHSELAQFLELYAGEFTEDRINIETAHESDDWNLA